MKNFFVLLLAAVALLASCAKEQMLESGVAEENLIPLNIDGSIRQVATKATAAGFVDNDAVGLFAVNYSEGNTVAGTLLAEGNQADNVKYVFNESSHKWVPVKSVYYKDINTNVDLFLYYPYQADISDVSAAGFEVKKDQSAAATATSLSGYEASDFLWGKGENITPVESAVAISLAHKLSAVQVVLVGKDGFSDGEFENLSKSVILTNTTRKATINYATGVATPLGAPQQDGIVMCPQNDGSFRAIVIPQSVTSNTRLFSITIDGISYGFEQPSAVEYLAGKQLVVTINITKKTPTGEYAFSLGGAQIVDWTEDKNTHGGEARQYYVVNVETPGTLGKLIKAAGKNPNKIKNLKVSGNVTDVDFYFMRDSMAILEAVNMKEASIKGSGKTVTSTYKTYSNYESYYIATYGQPDYEEGNYVKWIAKDNEFPIRAFEGKTSLCYFTFPEVLTKIREAAFSESNLSGALIIPDDVTVLEDRAFYRTNITSIQLPQSLEVIGLSEFNGCKSLTGMMSLPQSVRYIGGGAFAYCSGLSGRLIFPDNLTYIGAQAFIGCSGFYGDLTIPESVRKIYGNTFSGCSGLNGSLNLHGGLILSQEAVPWLNLSSYSGGGAQFSGCKFRGELSVPEANNEIPNSAFRGCNFSKISIPSSIKFIRGSAFEDCRWITEPLELPEGLISIADYAFHSCMSLPSITLPSTLQTIQQNAFEYCYNISGIVCSAVEPPSVLSQAFNGVAKDGFTVEVPEQSVIRYETESGWGDFKRIAGHYDFSFGRREIRCLNGGICRTYTLRAPSGFDWEVDETTVPEWITVSPTSGTGKVDVTINIADMARTNDTFEVNEGSFQYPSYKSYKGRSAELTFKLTEKDYSFDLSVEQYDYDYPDGYVKTMMAATKGPGIDIVYTGEGYDARDIARGTFLDNANAGNEHFFDLEPYKTYKDYFNVYSVIAMSDESGICTVNTIVDNKFIHNGIFNADECFTWAKRADSNMDLSKSLVILLHNANTYYGWTHMYGDGSAIAVVPVSTEAYPCDYRGLIQHEAGGHGFGKLGDEYIYHNEFIQSCGCLCCDHPFYEMDPNSSFGFFKSLGWFKNLSMYGDCTQVPWAHLIYHSQYSDKVDMYEGGYMHTRGVYRSEATSCMNNNIPYYSAISRQSIVERIKAYAEEEFDFNDFVAKDSWTVGTKSKMVGFDWTFGVDPKWNRGTEKGSIIYMGEHPNVK